MKKCPFCAEEIQDEAIKCRHCNSFLSAAPPTGNIQPVAAAAPAAAEQSTAPPFARAAGTPGKDEPQTKRSMLYEGNPSWKAYLGYYLAAALGAVILIAILHAVSGTGAPMQTKVLNVLIPVAVSVVFLFGLHLYRKSIKFRVSNTVIEYEKGFLSKRIDVVQLWRVKDVVYKQSLMDRIIGIAHIGIITSDATNPSFDILGLPASRQLFESLRDSIEIQRQSKNVYGVVS